MAIVKEHITVCLCTFKRPVLLRDLLDKLACLDSGGLFSYSVVVVDNDRERSAQETVEAFRESADLDVRYFIEPEQNIALARNRAVEQAKGDYLAFIDDDEFPEPGWLLHLYRALKDFGVDGVLAPVKPYYGQQCPRWIERSNLCLKRSHPTGEVVRATDSRTSNVLLKKTIFDDPENRFERQFGRTGGEDVWFFVRVIEKGYRFVWTEDAAVYETVPPERWKVSFYLRKALRMGGLTGEEVRTKGLPGRSFPLVTAVACAYLTMLPLTALLGKHNFMRCLMKGAYHFAWLSGYLGYVPIRLRDD